MEPIRADERKMPAFEARRSMSRAAAARSQGRLLLAACLLALAPALAAAAPVAPEFSLTSQDLGALTTDLPGSIRQAILANPRGFLHQLARVLDQPQDLLVLVDKSHLLGADYVPPDLVPLGGYRLAVSRNDLSLRRVIMTDVLAMVAAAKAHGVILLFSSSYRSYEYQREVYAREVKMYGQEAADRESAHAGASQHQLGTAIDFGSITDEFAGTRAGRWLAAHAWEYGFTLSYPKGYEQVTGYRWESWHYRYITRPAARLQREFFGDVQQYLLEFLDAHRAQLQGARSK
ncbi:MAG TPA: M15 family metallopeptidase [Spirochaetia bacterium]|nr:M15 family metallopeptidase [Spirochaetia bacterium]